MQTAVRKMNYPHRPFLSRRLAGMVVVAAALPLMAPASAIAVSGSALSDNATQAQYAQPQPPVTIQTPADNQGGTLGNQDQGNQGGTLGETGSPGGNENGAGNGNTSPVAVEGPEASGSGSSLPFTGMAAIPLLLMGALALAGGMTLRWRTRSRATSAA